MSPEASLAELPARELGARLRREGLTLRIGPFAVRLRSGLPEMARWLPFLYGAFPVASPAAFADFHVRVDPPAGLRRWWRPQVSFRFDVSTPFKPLPRSQALPFLEWGLNWCVARHAHQFLVIHAGVLERAGRVLVLPGPPGSGKSTLCAALMNRGWRLFSDELALLRPETGRVYPIPRPVSLKDEAIRVIGARFPGAGLGPLCEDTAKGTVAHLRPSGEAVRRSGESAPPGWLVRPEFRAGQAARLEPLAPEEGFGALADCAFNYNVLGPPGFHALADLAEGCPAYSLPYGDLDRACHLLEELAGAGGP